jgi:hypothetical protein
LVLEDVEGVKGEAGTEESSEYSSSCMEKVTEPCSDNCDDKMTCDSVPETYDENNSDKGKLLEQNGQKIPMDCRGYLGDKMECESSSILLNCKDSEITVPRAIWSTSKMNSESDNKQSFVDLLETRTSETLQVLSCSNSTDNSVISSFGSEKNVKILSPDVRRTYVSNTKDLNSEAEALETEVSSTVQQNCKESQKKKSVHLDECSNTAVTSSDEVSVSQVHGCKTELPEIRKEGTSIHSSVRQEKHFENSNGNISVNGISRTCTENTVKALEPRPSYIRIKTPGFGDDIIQSVEEVVICEKLGQKSNKCMQNVSCKTEEMVQENRGEYEVKTVSDVSSSGGITVSYVDDETLHNGQQMEAQKQDDSLLYKDFDGHETDEEGFNEDILCKHGKLNCKLLIVTVSPLQTLNVVL